MQMAPWNTVEKPLTFKVYEAMTNAEWSEYITDHCPINTTTELYPPADKVAGYDFGE